MEVITEEIDWSLDFRNEAVLDKWKADFERGMLVDATKVRQFIGELAYVWKDGMGTLLKQCQDLLRKRGCSRQVAGIDGAEGNVFSLGDALKLLNGGEEKGDWPAEFLEKTYCVVSYGKNSATLLCWARQNVSREMIKLCDAYGLDISIMPETRYGTVYDIVWEFQQQQQQ